MLGEENCSRLRASDRKPLCSLGAAFVGAWPGTSGSRQVMTAEAGGMQAAWGARGGDIGAGCEEVVIGELTALSA